SPTGSSVVGTALAAAPGVAAPFALAAAAAAGLAVELVVDPAEMLVFCPLEVDFEAAFLGFEHAATIIASATSTATVRNTGRIDNSPSSVTRPASAGFDRFPDE